MKIRVFSLRDAMFESLNGGNWISIRDFGRDELYNIIDTQADNILKLTFDDVDPYRVKHNMNHPFYVEEYKKRSPIYFNESMARSIIDFVDNLNGEDLNIHCWAGLSRSQAIGYAINIFYNGYSERNNDFISNIPNFSMVNPFVFNIMMNMLAKLKWELK